MRDNIRKKKNGGRMSKKLVLTTILALILAGSSAAYTIDGDISDWGVNLTAGLSGNASAWVPIVNTTDWKVENNIDDDCVPNTWQYGSCVDWTGYNAKGVHIEGHGTAYSDYDEPASIVGGRKYDGPAGGEPYDIEALYFDDTTGYVYFVIVTSMPETGYIDQYGRYTTTGDLALDLDRNSGTGEYGYEYGIKTHGPNKGQICYLPKWSLPHSSMGFPSNAPSTMTCNGSSSVVTGTASVVYANSGKSDNGRSNYIIEIKARKIYIGAPAKGDLGNLHTTITCGNDEIEIGDYTYDFPAPEFSSIGVPLVVLLIAPTLAFIVSRRE
jgi:hypothetical protein